MKTLFIFCLFNISCSFIYSQTTNNWNLYPSSDSNINNTTDSTIVKPTPDTIFGFTKVEVPGVIKINKDARIDKLSKELGTASDGTTVKIRGYRLQLIASSKKSVVDGQRAKFMGTNNDVPTYMDYVQPNYKLRVGDFKTKLEAQKLQHELRNIFPSALVVNDMVELSKL